MVPGPLGKPPNSSSVGSSPEDAPPGFGRGRSLDRPDSENIFFSEMDLYVVEKEDRPSPSRRGDLEADDQIGTQEDCWTTGRLTRSGIHQDLWRGGPRIFLQVDS